MFRVLVLVRGSQSDLLQWGDGNSAIVNSYFSAADCRSIVTLGNWSAVKLETKSANRRIYKIPAPKHRWDADKGSLSNGCTLQLAPSVVNEICRDRDLVGEFLAILGIETNHQFKAA